MCSGRYLNVKKCLISCVNNFLCIIDSAGYAFNPKDIRLNKKTPSPDSEGKRTESEIKERICRLSNTLANKVCLLLFWFSIHIMQMKMLGHLWSTSVKMNVFVSSLLYFANRFEFY